MLESRVFVISFLLMASAMARYSSYSFQEFRGPVSDEFERIQVPNKHGHGVSYDYNGKPDYSFSYGVDDEYTGDNHQHKEVRNGDEVTGEYSVIQPDGKVRLVRYSADPRHGFQADVEYKNARK